MSEITLQNVALPKITRATTTKYPFAELTVGGPAIVMEVLDAKKGVSKLTSALVAYRARSGDQAKYTVRAFKAEDGTDRIGCWKTGDAPAAAE